MPSADVRPRSRRSRATAREASLPGWLVFFLLGMAAITAADALPQSDALPVMAGVATQPRTTTLPAIPPRTQRR